MQEVGNLLKSRREEKQITLEQAARETNIAPRYLDALEVGHYEVFPGEPYIVGFLRNYAEYLGLDPNECIKYYKNVQMQETMIPTNVLVPKRVLRIPRILILVLLITVLAAAGFFIISFFGKKAGARIETVTPIVRQEQPAAVEKTSRYTLSDKEFEKRLFAGDRLILPLGEKSYELTVIKTAPELHIGTAAGTQIVELGQSIMLDMDNDTVADINITVEDLDKTSADKGALVEIRTGGFGKDSTADTTVIANESVVNTDASKYKVLLDSGSAYPVTLKAAFRTYCLFRYEQDHTNRAERYYQKSEQVTIQANNGIRIWASNGNAVKMQLIAGGKTIDIEVGRPGKVMVKDLKWIRSKENRRYKFVMMDVD